MPGELVLFQVARLRAGKLAPDVVAFERFFVRVDALVRDERRPIDGPNSAPWKITRVRSLA